MWIIDAKKAHPNLAPKDSTVILLDTEVLILFFFLNYLSSSNL